MTENNSLALDEILVDLVTGGKISRYKAAEAVRDEAQTIMNAERDSRIRELRRMADEGKAAEKELAALKPVGAPRKPRRKRKDLEAPVTA